jgi:hypothetical protein
MATSNHGGNRKSNGGRRGRNNNPEGRNQYSGMIGAARANQIATAAAVGGAVAAGVFLWSRRNQISDQIGNLADTISEWRESHGDLAGEDITAGQSFTDSGSRARGKRQSQAEIAEEALTLKEIGESA